MLENNVAVEVIHKIKDDLIHEIVDKPITRGKTEEVIISTLKRSLDDVLSAEKIDLLKACKSKKPFVISGSEGLRGRPHAPVGVCPCRGGVHPFAQAKRRYVRLCRRQTLDS